MLVKFNMEVFSSPLYYVKLYLVFIFVGNQASCVVSVTTIPDNWSQAEINSTTPADSNGTTFFSTVTTSSEYWSQNETISTELYASTSTTFPPTTIVNTTYSETTSTTDVYTTTTIPTTTTELPCNYTPYIEEINISNVLDTKADLYITLKSDDLVLCNEVDLIINCEAVDTWPWITQTTLNYLLQTNQSVFYFEFRNLSEYTRYNCSYKAIGGNVVNRIFQTAQVAPSNPTNLKVTTITSSSFNVTWEEPAKYPSKILGYNISVTRGNVSSLNHYWSRCENEPDDNYSYFTNSSDQFFYHFDKALPDFNYIVTIWAFSEAGLGSSANTILSTLISESEPPKNLTDELKLQHFQRNIETTLNLLWDMPCNTNGPVKYFIIEIKGYYLLNASIEATALYNLTIDSDREYNISVPNLMAASNYSVKIYATRDTSSEFPGAPSTLSCLTEDNYPSAPQVERRSIFARNWTVYWNEPDNNPGKITGYAIIVSSETVNWGQVETCNINSTSNYTFYTSDREYTAFKLIPDTTYNVAIFAETSQGRGNSTNLKIISNEDLPDLPTISSKFDQHIGSRGEYNVSRIIHFTPGCFNGKFESYNVSYKGSRNGHEDHLGSGLISDYNYTNYSCSLRPEHDYVVNVTVQNTEFHSLASENFTSPVGVPTINGNYIQDIEPVISSTEVVITLNRNYFDDSQGTMKFLALIVSDQNMTGGEFSEWNGLQWPIPSNDEVDVYYQATPKFWNPFNASQSINYTLGQGLDVINCLEQNELICNRPLEPSKTYFVFIRVFNTNFYRNSMPIRFETDPASKLKLILGIISSVLIVSAIGFGIYILWRRGIINGTNIGIIGELARQKRTQNDTSACDCDRELLMNCLNKNKQPGPETEYSKEKFIEYCNYLENNPDELNKQWQDLTIESENIYANLQNNFALLPENRRKNRFTNILPFDHSRVKLNIDEDDEICSDYINASYIKGFSSRPEYIATQGPLPHTVRDFWKMIFQENVSIIVMVARFIENKREKCYKYFPNNHETMAFGDDIEVRCSAELHFEIYCVRTLQVRKDVKQLTITHMQFLEWPDFGVPEGTENLLSFCHQFRSRWVSEGGMAVVHCSAGVGRTGTIIATDLLIQAVEAEKKIDVFNTLLELRRQRKNMVQTEKQYLYIHQLVRSILETPITDDDDNSEHLYQNIELATGNKMVESAF